MTENVNHPAHYNTGGPECIDVIESLGLGYHLGCAAKYIYRAGIKTPDPGEDLRKAFWYVERYDEGWVYAHREDPYRRDITELCFGPHFPKWKRDLIWNLAVLNCCDGYGAAHTFAQEALRGITRAINDHSGGGA